MAVEFLLKVKLSNLITNHHDNIRCSLDNYLPPISDPCTPSPCGPFSVCKSQNGHAICSCSVGYIGSPPACRPECVVSSDCSLDKACNNQKCIDPCPGTCGVNARCNVRNHSPICSCPLGYVGDPFVRCFVEDSKKCLLKTMLNCFKTCFVLNS